MSFLLNGARHLMASQVRPPRATPGQTLGVRWERLPIRDHYALLKAYYQNNALYEQVSTYYATQEPRTWQEALKPLRNPTYRCVEVYVAKLWGGPLDVALPIRTENERIIEPIEQIWKWSNWGSRKQRAARWLALYGDLFIKVAQPTDVRGNFAPRVYFDLLDPQYVTDFDKDERGFLTYARIDVPRTRRVRDKVESFTHTEVWDKRDGTYTLWEHDRGADEDTARLGTPTQELAIRSFGIDFIPIVHIMLRDVGEDRGQAAITPAIDKIDELNRVVTRLHQQLFRHNGVTWALQANQVGPDGRPSPAPQLAGEEDGQVRLGDETIARLPGNSSLTPLTPALHYGEHLAIANAHQSEIELDLPELAYYRIKELKASSGVAIRLELQDMIDKIEEARGNAYDGLARANAMALTIAQFSNLFRDLGTFEAGDFDHHFDAPEVIANTEMDELEQRKARAEALEIEQRVIPLPPVELLKQLDRYDQKRIDELVALLPQPPNGMVTDGSTPLAETQR